MSDAELDALIETTNKLPQAAPGLLAWLDSACVWEVRRRAGDDYELHPPEAAIPPEENAISVEAAIALRVRFTGNPSLGALFDALVDLFTGTGERH